MGAWTELFVGCSLRITPRLNECYVVPWSMLGKYDEGLQKAIEEGKGEKLGASARAL